MIEIWQECSSFQTTIQRLANQVRTTIKKSSFSDLEILEIHQKINNEQDSNTISDTKSIILKSLTEMNQQRRKKETPDSQATHNQTHNQTTQSKHKYKNKKLT